VIVDVRLPAKLRPLAQVWQRPDIRHACAYGGRGSAKSHTIAQIWLLRGMESPERVLCFREIQKSIRDSVHRLLSDKINAMGLGPFYEVTRDEIRGRNGTLFLFAGLRDHTADSVKSFEGLTGAWGEEAHSITEESALKLIPTVRGCSDPKIFWSWNPESETDYVHQRFVVRGDPSAVVVKANYLDNPWFPPPLEAERLHLKALNEDLYRHVWEGECRTAAGLLFKRHWFKWYDKAPERLNKYLASDYAVSQDEGDFTEHGIFGLDESGDLWITDWWYGQTDPETWIDAAFAMIRRHQPLAWFEEKGVILRAVDASITKRMRERQTFVGRHPLASAGNKAERALGFAARASAGTVWLPKGQPWAERLVNQLCAFNGEDGRVDDGVDVCSLAARGLDTMMNARPAPKPKAVPKPGTIDYLDYLDRQKAGESARAASYYK